MATGRALLFSATSLRKLMSNVGLTDKGTLSILKISQQGGVIRGIKTTSTVHPKPVYDEEDKVLEKVLQERQKSEDLPEGLANPYEKTKKLCIMCEHGIEPNYKNVKLLYQFVSPYTGKVYGKHITGLCKAKHTKLENEISLAVSLGFMSNYLKEVEFLKDPKLCDPDRPVKPHPH